MRYIAGIDIGNSSTEIALATLSATGELSFVSSAPAETTGIKGTLRNVHGIQEALAQATKKSASMLAIFRLFVSTKQLRLLVMWRWKPSLKLSSPNQP